MLSRAGSSRLGLVCSDCGTPQAHHANSGKPHPLTTGVTLVSLTAFSLLLFFLTNWRPVPTHQADRQRALMKQLTTGEFVREPEPIEKSAHSEE